MDPMTLAAIAGTVSAGAGMYGSNQAASAQQASAEQQAKAARRNLLYQTQVNEPARFLGYNAMADLSAELGYGMQPYASAQQLAATVSPLNSKDVVKALRNGVSLEQVQQMGTLNGGLNPKSLRRLQRAGLTPEQIQGLSVGAQMQGAPAAPGSAGSVQGRGFTASPDYQFRLNEGQRNIGNSFAARGGAASGNAMRALTEFNSGQASQEYDKWFSRRAQMAGMGTQQQAQAGNNYSNALMGSQQAAGDARASGVMGTANSIAGGINSGLNTYFMADYMRNRQGPGTGYQVPSQPWGTGTPPPLMNPYRGGY